MHILCPHCRNPIELIKLSAEEILCPTCGSSFKLETGSTTGWSPKEDQRKIGKFEILSKVGVGAFGTVYKARDPELDRIVAVKVPRAGNLDDGQDLDRFLREARSVAQLRHPGIVPVYDVGQADGVPFLVSDFVDGVTLADQLTARQLPPREAAQLIAQVADALQYAHERGVVHRDVKPSNIMLSSVVRGPSSVAKDKEGSRGDNGRRTTDNGLPMLMDFGLAKREAGEITMTIEGQVLGTPAYMSPEQARGAAHQVDGRSDVYSLGVIFYRLLTGELPFRGNTRMLLHQVLHEEPIPPRKLNNRTPGDLETICLKAMAKEPGRRYQTAGTLAEDLRRWLKGEPIRARPVGQAERLWRWCRRNPVVAALLAAVTFLLVSGTGVVTYFAIQANARAREAMGRLYISDMRLAQLAWNDNQIGRLLELLEGQRPERTAGIDLRGFEWHYWWRRSDSSLLTLPGYGGPSVAYSPDGKRIVSNTDHSGVGVCDAETGQGILTLNEHDAVVWSIAYSPDGKWIAGGSSQDNTVRVWDAFTGRQILTLFGHKLTIFSVAFSPNSKQIVSGGSDSILKVWDAATGQCTKTLKGHTSAVTSAVFSPDGKRIVSGSWDRTVKVWDAATGQEIFTLHGHEGGVSSLAFSPDGKRIVSGSYYTLKIWTAETGQEIMTIKGHPVTSLAFSPDSKRIVSGSNDSTLKIWDAATGQEILTLKGHTERVSSVAYSPDGKRIISASWDDTIKVWDAVNGQEPPTLKGHTSDVWCVTFSPDGKQIISGSLDNALMVWDATTCQQIRTLMGHTGSITGLAFSPDGKRIVSSSWDKTVKFWDAASGQEILTLLGHTEPVMCVAYSPDGKRIVSGSQDHAVKIWEVASGKETVTLQCSGEVWGVAWSPDGKKVASVSMDNSLRLWDAETGREILTLEGHTEEELFCVAYSPDGMRIVAGSDDHTLKVWDAASGQEILRLKGHAAPVRSVAFSPDGKRIVSASEDKALKVWETATGQETLTLKGHADEVLGVAFSPDGNRIVSASRDGTIKIWDARPME